MGRRVVAIGVLLGCAACGSLIDTDFFGGGDDDPPRAPAVDAGGVAADGAVVDASGQVTPGGDKDTGPIGPGPDLLVFVTDGEISGSLKDGAGNSVADQRCQKEADEAGLSKTFRALVNVETGKSPWDRITPGTGAYIRADGKRVANSFAELRDLPHLAPIDISFAGTVLAARTEVWTGVESAGGGVSASPPDCNGWTSEDATVEGAYGVICDRPCGQEWLSGGIGACKVPRHLYCIEEP